MATPMPRGNAASFPTNPLPFGAGAQPGAYHMAGDAPGAITGTAPVQKPGTTTPPVSTPRPTDLQGWMTKYQSFAALAKANAARFDKALAAEKKKPHPNSERVAYFSKQSAAVKAELGHWNEQIAGTQNKIYVQTGQYD